MKGLHLRSLTGELHRVPAHLAHQPVAAIPKTEERTAAWRRYRVQGCGVTDYAFLDEYHRMPLKALKPFTFDELCKLNYRPPFTMDESVGKLFERNARYEVVRKIHSSMWRWSVSKGTWNEVVDAYENIRHFRFIDDPNFAIRLDHATYWNEFGVAKYSRIYIDGAFAVLVYYKRQHVMTIGFSILAGKRLLIQQVQSAKRSGNRYLYRLPKNRMQFVVERFLENFPGYCLYVIDGKSLTEKTLSGYRENLQIARKYATRGDDEGCALLEEKIAHLEADAERLGSFYGDVGCFALGSPQTFKGLTHYPVMS